MNDKNIKLVSIFLIFLILLIFITTFFEDDNDKQEILINSIENDTIDEYKKSLEEDIYIMLSKMQGVGEANVSITLESGVEHIYVTQGNNSTDTSLDSQRSTNEITTLLIEDNNGRKQALLKKSLEPTVRGVVIVCEGGDNMLIVASVTQAIKALLNISSTNIYVTN